MFLAEMHNEIESCGKDLLHLSESVAMPVSVNREGRISRIGMIPGILYVVEDLSQQTYGINLRDLEGYRGESPKELGLTVGAKVRFRTAGEQQVVKAERIRR